MNSRYWKNSLKQINNGLDKCDATLDALNKNNFDGIVSKEIYKSPDTLVEVNIRTKKASSTSKSPLKTHLGKPSSKYPKQFTSKRSNLTRNIKKKEDKSFDQESSPVKKENSGSGCNSGRRVTFQHRTLKLVLGEIKSILKQGEVEQALQHLEDVEYIALNLNAEGLHKLTSPCKKPHVSNELDEPDASTMKKAVSSIGIEKQNLERELAQTRMQLDQALRVKAELHNALDSQEKKMEDMKGLISRLSSTNEDMVLHLKEKIRLEDSLKVLEAANQQLSIKYEKARSQNQEATRALRGKEMEVKALRKIIEDMKKALLHDFNERHIKHSSFTEEAPSLSSELSKLSLLISESSGKSSSQGGNIESDEGVFSESVALPSVLRTPPTKDTPSLRTIVIQERSEEVPYGENASLMKNTLNAKVKDFLERMKNTSNLEISLPETPVKRSFDEMSLPLNLTEDTDSLSGTLDKNTSKLTDSSSFYVSSIESSGS